MQPSKLTPTPGAIIHAAALYLANITPARVAAVYGRPVTREDGGLDPYVAEKYAKACSDSASWVCSLDGSNQARLAQLAIEFWADPNPND